MEAAAGRLSACSSPTDAVARRLRADGMAWVGCDEDAGQSILVQTLNGAASIVGEVVG